jgi:hypothetical protein
MGSEAFSFLVVAAAAALIGLALVVLLPRRIPTHEILVDEPDRRRFFVSCDEAEEATDAAKHEIVPRLGDKFPEDDLGLRAMSVIVEPDDAGEGWFVTVDYGFGA